jgi:hypothetical protein
MINPYYVKKEQKKGVKKAKSTGGSRVFSFPSVNRLFLGFGIWGVFSGSFFDQNLE